MDQDLRRAPPCQLLLGAVLPAALWMWWKAGGCVPGAVHSVATQLFLLAPGGETGARRKQPVGSWECSGSDSQRREVRAFPFASLCLV